MKKFVPVAMALAILLAILLVGVAMAGTPSNIRMSDAPDGAEVTHFPSGTTVVYYIFDYTDMEGEELKVRVYDNVGNIIFEQTKTYSGSGTESIAISPSEGVFADSRYVTNLYRGEYLGKTIIWQVGEPPTSPPPTVEAPAPSPGGRVGNFLLIPILIVVMILLIIFVFWALRRALAAG